MTEKPDVSLRPFEPGDAAAVTAGFNNPEATRTLMEQRASFSRSRPPPGVERAMDDSGEDRKYAIVVEGYEEPVRVHGSLRPPPPDSSRAGRPDRRRRPRQGSRPPREALTIAKAFDEFGAHRVLRADPGLQRSGQAGGDQPRLEARGDDARHLRRDGELADCEVWGVLPEEFREALARGGGWSVRAELLEDAGAAAAADEFFRSQPFMAAEGVTHSLRISTDVDLLAPLIVREIPGGEGLDATSPYGFPGLGYPGYPIGYPGLPGPLEPASVDWSPTGLVSVFIRHRVGSRPPLALPPSATASFSPTPSCAKSRPSDRQQIRRNLGAATRCAPSAVPTSRRRPRRLPPGLYADDARAAAAERYFYDAAYFRGVLAFADSWSAACGELAARRGGIAARPQRRALHYYLSGTADAHLRDSPMKNVVTAICDLGEQRGLPVKTWAAASRRGTRSRSSSALCQPRTKEWHSRSWSVDAGAYDGSRAP